MLVVFLFQTLLIFAIGALLVLLVRALPRLPAQEAHMHKPDAFERLLSRLPMERLDSAWSGFLEKTLRRLRVILLKIDNLLNGSLERVRRHEKQKLAKPTLATTDLFPKASAAPPSPPEAPKDFPPLPVHQEPPPSVPMNPSWSPPAPPKTGEPQPPEPPAPSPRA